MNFVIVGCGRVGADLSYRLFKAGHQIAVVDSNREAFNRLPPEFRGRGVRIAVIEVASRMARSRSCCVRRKSSELKVST